MMYVYVVRCTYVYFGQRLGVLVGGHLETVDYNNMCQKSPHSGAL